MKEFTLTFLILLAGINSNSQAHTLDQKHSPIRQILVVEDNLFGIDSAGRLSIWNLQTLEKIYISDTVDLHYTTISKDQNNTIYLGTNNGNIFKFNVVNYTEALYLKLKRNYYIYRIFFNTSNEILLIVPYAVLDPINNKYWTRFEHYKNGRLTKKRVCFFFYRKVNKYFDMPQYTFIDSKDRIWMTNSYGEFGGSIQLFDAKNRQILTPYFDNLDFGLLFPKSVFEDNKMNIYITSGLQHFGNTGEIYKIEKSTASLIYDGKDFKDTTITNIFNTGSFVGPGTFNVSDNKIYFATTEGVYKADIPLHGKIKNPQLVCSPDLVWESEPLAVGIAMTIKNLEIAKNHKLIFLTSNNGVGVFDGEKLVMIK